MNRRLLHVTTTDISLRLLLGAQLRAFAKAGWDVFAASAPGPDVEELESWGVHHIPLRHATRSFAPHRDMAALVELYQVIRRVRPGIVHTHNPKPGVYGRLAARAAGVPVINTVHGLYASADDGPARRALVYGLERLAASCSVAELVQNPEDVQTLVRLRVPERRLVSLGNGIDLERFDPAIATPTDRSTARHEMGVGPDDLMTGVVGRLVWEKGLREVFQAAEILRHRAPRVRVVLIGPMESEKGDALNAADIARAKATGIQFLGRRDDMVRLYAAMDLYVLASHREGFPRSAMEAASMGLPIIATNIRGCRQVVDTGRTGLLVPTHDPSALASAIAELASAPERRSQMGEAGRIKAQREFDQQRVIDRTLAAYDAVIGDGRLTART